MSLAAPCSSRLSRSTSSSSHSTPRLDRGEDVNGICTKGRYPRSGFHSSARRVRSHVGVLVGVLVVHEVIEAAVRAGVIAVAGADLLAGLVLPLLVRHVGALASHRFEVVERLTRCVAVLLGAIPVLVADRDPAGAVLLDGGGGGGFLEVAVVALSETDLHGRPHIAWRTLSFPAKPRRNVQGSTSRLNWRVANWPLLSSTRTVNV